MIPATDRSRALLRLAAVLFAAATSLYSGIWMYCANWERSVQLGIDEEYSRAEAAVRILRVVPGTAAEAAGLRAGDRIVTADGERLTSLRAIGERLDQARPGTRMRLLVERPGESGPLTFDVVLRAPLPRPSVPAIQWVAFKIIGSYPVLFLLVGVAVLLLRPEDRHAWLMALLFAALIAAAPLLDWEQRIPSTLRGFALAYKVGFGGLMPGLFLFFFAVFPAPSPIDQRLPWLKWLWLGAALAVSLPLAAWLLAAGSSNPLHTVIDAVGEPVSRTLARIHGFGGILLGFVSLIWNALRGPVAARRKSRVMVWGTLLGFGPSFVLQWVATSTNQPMYAFPFWIWGSAVILILLIPLSFAYAVIKYRVLEIPVLLRRSARYLLVQRGSIGLLVLLGAGTTLVFADSFSRVRPWTEGALPVGVTLGTAFGTVLVWAGSRVQRRVRERIDRAFFRSVYDARQILQDLAERARAATSRQALGALLDGHLRSALFPISMAVYLEAPSGTLRAESGDVPAGLELLGPLPALTALARRAEPWEVLPEHLAACGPLALMQPDCLVPILGREASLTGLIVLGPRLSEEPYSREDKRLLASVASQAGIALQSLRLAEQMAERLEAERLAAHERELAKQVQTRFLPQQTPTLATLECAGRCIQAREVGGDYYDFLELGPGRLGLVLADISGKGFPAALLMANLHASLRSRSARDLYDLPGQLRSVNQLLYHCSELNRYATLFLGIYDDDGRALNYANCGHNPPVLLRADGSVERLQPTAPVLGLLLEQWDCTTGRVSLASGDLLVLFTDGITEAFSDAGEEFGEERLIATLRAQREQPLACLLDTVVDTVRRFSGSEQEDDLTLVVARAR